MHTIGLWFTVGLLRSFYPPSMHQSRLDVKGLPMLTIGEVARRTGRRTSAIRYYEDIGVLPAPVEEDGRRRYDEQVIRTLSVIDTAQRAGLSLDEIKALLGASSDDSSSIDRLRAIAGQEKLPEIRMLVEQTTRTGVARSSGAVSVPVAR